MAFEQATIKVERQQEFSALQAAVEEAFRPQQVEKFLKQMDRKSVRMRDFDGVLAKKVLESVGSREIDAGQLYQALSLSDQGQMREFYLSKLETVEQALRHKFKKLYQYY
ncbi:MAG TPA: hypothetical protein VMH04_14940 [Candidatus Solibacter sp.]|nr:hypothetical protein [Candidatus Solibacter sp.]